VIQRIYIEDLVVQDGSSVVFRATDTESQNEVAVQRFIPFGRDGSGLNAAQKAVYENVIRQATAVRDENLRKVIGGDCDPLDGYPYLVTEWVPGISLKKFLEVNPIPSENAVKILLQVFEICEKLSAIFEVERVWIETRVDGIFVKDEDEGEEPGSILLYWLSPLKTLGRAPNESSLAPIIYLTEQLMERSGKKGKNATGQALHTWLNWLRMSGKSVTLKQAHDALIAGISVGRTSPTKQLVQQVATRPIPSATDIQPVVQASSTRPAASTSESRPATKNNGNKKLRIVFYSVMIAMLWAGGWFAYQHSSFKTRLHPKTMAEKAAETEAAYAVQSAKLSVGVVNDQPNYSPDDWQLSNKVGKVVSIQGVLRDMGYSSGPGKTLYLYFIKPSERTHACGAILLSKVGDDLQEEALKKLIGKKIRITGELKASSAPADRGQEIPITKRDAIIVLP
jgi:hypothetical protein